jgi:hypothetical protein
MITVLKTAKGYRWVAVSSTAYRDRDNEIVSTKALRNAVKNTDVNNAGPLRFWHEPGLDIGTTDFQLLTDDGKYLIESGLFNNAQIAQNVAKAVHKGEWQMSLGFRHPLDEPDRGGVFHTIQIFERSIVPGGKAANPQTSFTVGRA